MTATDFELARRFASDGDASAFGALVDRHAGLVFHVALRITGSHHEAEDVTQDVFLRLTTLLGRYTVDRSFRAWIAAITVNTALKAVRTRTRRDERERRVAAVNGPEDAQRSEALSEQDRRELAAKIEERIGELPVENRIPVVLHYMEGMTYAMIGEATGVPEGTAKSRVSRGLDQIRSVVCRDGKSIPALAFIPLLQGIQAPAVPETLIAALKALPAAAGLGAGGAAGAACAAAESAGMSKVSLAIAAAAVALCSGVFLGLGSAAGLFGTGQGAAGIVPAEVPAPAFHSAEPPAVGARRAVPASHGKPASPSTEPPAEAGKGGGKVPAGPGPAEPALPQQKPRAQRVSWDAGLAKGEPPEQRTALSTGSGGPGIGIAPAGYSKWAPEPPPKGNCGISGRVVDSGGRPIAGADVYRTRPGEAPEGPVVHFGMLVKAAVSGPDGAFEIAELLQGEYRLIANYHNALNLPKGIDFTRAVCVKLSFGQVLARVELGIPVSAASFASVQGRVLGHDRMPFKGAEVRCGFVSVRTDGSGAFSLPAVPAGEAGIVALATGYKPAVKTLNVSSGEAVKNLEIVLELNEPGENGFSGTVSDSFGSPIPGASVYVMAPGRTIRSVTADASGSFGVDAILQETVTVQASKPGYLTARFEQRLPASAVRFVLEKLVTIRGTVRSAADGEVQRQVNLKIFRETADGERVYAGGMSVYTADGSFSIQCAKGRLFLSVESPGHGPDFFEILAPLEGESIGGLELALEKSAE